MTKRPTDEYGFAAAMRAGLAMFDAAGRRSGRTSRMVERARDGDTIVCPTDQIARYVRDLCQQAGKAKIRVVVCDPGTAPMRLVGTAPNGRAFFEHTWVYQYFTRALAAAQADLEGFHVALSKDWPRDPQITPEQRRAEWLLHDGPPS